MIFKKITFLILFITFITFANEWRIVYEEDYEESKIGENRWTNMGASGPEGGSWQGVTDKTNSSFDYGWQAYEFRLGKGGSLRERYYWLYKPINPPLYKGNIYFRFDFMADSFSIKEGVLSFEFLGGEKENEWGSLYLWFVGLDTGWLVFAGKKLLEIEPYIWYRVEIEIEGYGEKENLKAKINIYSKEKNISEKREIDFTCKTGKILQNLKVAVTRRDNKNAFSFYIDNLNLKIKQI